MSDRSEWKAAFADLAGQSAAGYYRLTIGAFCELIVAFAAHAAAYRKAREPVSGLEKRSGIGFRFFAFEGVERGGG